MQRKYTTLSCGLHVLLKHRVSAQATWTSPFEGRAGFSRRTIVWSDKPDELRDMEGKGGVLTLSVRKNTMYTAYLILPIAQVPY